MGLLKRLVEIVVSAVIGVLMIFSHEFVDAILKAVLYYIPTSLEGVGIPVQMTYINIAISIADTAFIVIGAFLILISVLDILRLFTDTGNGTII